MKRKGTIVVFVFLLVLLLSGCRSAETKAADAAIEAIGSVSLGSIDLIQNAESLVNGLDSKERSRLKNMELLTHARDSYDVLYLENLIQGIGPVSLDSKDTISSIRKEYDKSNETVKAAVSNYPALVKAEEEYDAIFAEKYVQPVEKAINDIGTVRFTKKCKNTIEAARTSYDAATEEAKAKVSNADILIAAEESFEQLGIQTIEEAINGIGIVTLDSKSKIKDAREKYDLAGQKIQDQIVGLDILVAAEAEYERLKTEADIQKVIDLIDSIGPVTLDSLDAIKEAEFAYNSLGTRTNKEKVANYETLVNARTTYNDLREKEYDSALSRMRVSVDEIKGTTFYKPNQMPQYTNSRCSVLPYIGMESKSIRNNWIVIRYNYAGRSWVFFKSVIIMVDDKKYTKYFDYFDITRDNGGGMVGEVIQDFASEEDIEMLRRIVTSKKTVVRFEGDDYVHDYELTDSDKSAIKDVLFVYDYMNFINR